MQEKSQFVQFFDILLDSLISAFSVIRSIKEISSLDSNPNEISCLHGIRFLNVIFLYLSHKVLAMNFEPYTNKSFIDYLSKIPISYPFRCIYIYTDVFLMLSGMLMSYGLTGKLQKGRVISLKSELIGRYIRVMPSTAVVILFSSYILPYLFNGPLWNLITEEADLCKKFGWRNFLMVQNYFGIENICRPQTHHVTTDFTLFAISVFLLVFLHKRMKILLSLLVALGMISMIGRFVVTFKNELVVFMFFGVK